MKKRIIDMFFKNDFKYVNISDIANKNELCQLFRDAIFVLNKNFPSFVDNIKFKRVVYLGDLHGSLESFKFICDKFYDKNTLFVILGDLIDRRKKSVELFVIVMCLIIEKKNVLYIKGNHETKDLQTGCSNYTTTLHYYLLNQYYVNRKNVYSYDLIDLMFNIFKELPLVFYYNGILNFHGGFINNKNFSLLKDFKKLKKKKKYKTNSPEHQILWNDPLEKWTKSFKSNYLRGDCGYVYGEKTTKEFFKNNKQVKLVITGHTHKFYDIDIDGYHFCHEDKILTLLSCFNSQQSIDPINHNKGGVAVFEDNVIKLYTFYLKEYREFNEHGKIDKEYGKFENNEEWILKKVEKEIKIV